MTDKQSGDANLSHAHHSSSEPTGAHGSSEPLTTPPDPCAAASAIAPLEGTWPATYSSPHLKKFGTLTELTLSGTASGNFETNLLTKKYRPKPKS